MSDAPREDAPHLKSLLAQMDESAQAWQERGLPAELNLDARAAAALRMADFNHAVAVDLLRAQEARSASLAESFAHMAESMADNEPDGYYGQACYEVAAAIRASASKG